MYWTCKVSKLGYGWTKLLVTMYSKYTAHISSNRSQFLTTLFLMYWTYKVSKFGYSWIKFMVTMYSDYTARTNHLWVLFHLFNVKVNISFIVNVNNKYIRAEDRLKECHTEVLKNKALSCTTLNLSSFSYHTSFYSAFLILNFHIFPILPGWHTSIYFFWLSSDYCFCISCN